MLSGDWIGCRGEAVHNLRRRPRLVRQKDLVVPYMVLRPDKPNLNGYPSIRNTANRFR